MKKIITAINNPKLNEELKKEKKFEIIGKDIQYKEAILEILEKNKFVDLIIISEKIPGEIKLESLIEKIKIVNEKIKIIFILEKENINLEKILIKNNIIDIYYNNKIDLNELIKIINKKEINMEEEIIKLKKIIEEKNINYNNNEKIYIKKNRKKKIKEFIKKSYKKIKNKIKTIIKDKIKENKKRNISTKIISFSGNYKSGKSTFALIISQCLSEKKYKVLLIDGDIEKQDLTIILRKDKKGNYIKNAKKNIKSKYKKNLNNSNKQKKLRLEKINNNKFINKKNKINYFNCKRIIKLFTSKINGNLYFFYGLNHLLKNKIISKEEKNKKIILCFFEIIKKDYDFVIVDLSKSNQDKINQEILKNSYTNFIFMEPTLLGINEIQKLLNMYLTKWKIQKNSIHIVENRKNFASINRKLISKYLPVKNKIYKIKENKFYYVLTNHHFKRKILIKKKNIKYDLNKIIKKIIYK